MLPRPLKKPLQTLYGLYANAAFVSVIAPVSLGIIGGPTLPIRRFIGRQGVKLAMLAIGTPVQVRGLEHLPDGACVCVANHASYLDGLVLTAALPARFNFLVQHGAATWPLVGKTIQRMGVSFVNRGSSREAALSIRDLLRRLHEGESFTIFAEGTFRREPGLLPFHNGAFLIAAKAGVPVVPAVIRGTRQLFPEGAVLARKAAVEIDILPPILPTGAGREAVRHLREQVRAAILAHCGEPDAAHLAAPDTSAD